MEVRVLIPSEWMNCKLQNGLFCNLHLIRKIILCYALSFYVSGYFINKMTCFKVDLKVGTLSALV